MTANRESVVGVRLKRVNGFAVLFVGLLATITAQADVFHLPSGQTSLQFVLVGNTGNPNDPTTGGVYGDVPYIYNVGKYNVTVAQYTAFLNAVAATDTYALYNSQMATRANIAGIARSGSSGSYAYSVIGSLNQPIAYVSWGDTARFANWLTNGQPTGLQGAGTTETGSYTLNGATIDDALGAVTRNATARYVIPTENEWYKAAYYDPTKGGTNYWLYPMRTDNLPFSAMPPGNGAPNATQAGNFYLDDKTANSFDNGYALTGSIVPDFNQNYLTDVGAYSAASSYYGTFDQGDDLSSWDETTVTGTKRGQRGGSWVGSEGTLRSTYRYSAPPSFEDVAYGMRIALISAPGDFNGDGIVDAADYVIWRKYDGSDAAAYETWRANFGTPAGSGAAVATVPEPPAALLIIVAVAILAIRGHNSIIGGRRNGTSRVCGIFILSLIAVTSNVSTVHALTFQLSYDASVASAPAEFLPAFNSAIQFYQSSFTDPITIKLQVGWGTVNNQNMSAGAFGQSLVNGQINSNFGGVKSALISDSKSAADQTSIAHLPATDPTGGAPYLIAYAEAKAVGLLPANAPALDGFVGFSKTASFTFDPNHRAVFGKYDFIGVAEHEISEVMGRYGMGQNSGQLGRYSPIDDFRYASPGTLDLAPMNGAYFSIDGGITVINTFKGPGGGDLSDWLGTTIDSYNAGPTIAVENAVSAGDITVMDVIGYDAASPLVTGDFNFDGVVDAADYVLWRKSDGTPDGYNAWRTHFGEPSGAGTNSANIGELIPADGSSSQAAVPEPSCALLLILGAALGTLKGRTMHRKVSFALAALCLLAFDAPSASAELTFNFINQGTATPQMMTGFAQAGALWSAYLKDPITINIRVGASALSPGVLGHTDIFYDPFDYTSVRTALVNDRLSVDDFSSTNTLQAAPVFSMLINRTANNPNGVVSLTPYFDTGLGGPGQAGPENNNTVRFPEANAKALGLIPNNPNLLDGIVTFTTSPIFDFDRSNGITSNRIDFVGVAAHEIGHVLGFTTGVDLLIGNSSPPGSNDNTLKFVTPLDLFRFTSRSIGPGGGIGVIDWTGDDTDKYFSVDGGQTALATFSRGTNDEEGHWKNDAGIGIMDPSAVAGDLLKISGMDVRAMDVIGYNLVANPSLAGDYNSNGVVDAADYVMWRKNEGTSNALPNNLVGGPIGMAQYNQWRVNFGNTSPGAGAGATADIPEPGPLVLLMFVAAGCFLLRRRAV